MTEPQKESTVLVKEPSARMVRIYRLEDLRKEALARADSMVSGKGADYGHWSEYPEVVIAGIGFAKAKRALELALQRASNPDHKPKFEALEDTALDGINYFSFLYGKAKGAKDGLL